MSGDGSEPAPTRAELELALRAAHLSIAELREDVMALAAQVVALSERVAAGAEQEQALAARTAELRDEILLSDERTADRVLLGTAEDKYQVQEEAGDGGPPCAELLPLCQARCCSFEVALSTQDLDEGQLRWSYARPYLLERRDREHGGMCAYHDGAGCTAYAARPATCRRYDCRGDARVWVDYERRILAPAPDEAALGPAAGASPPRQALMASARSRRQALFVEASRLRRKP